MFRHAHILDKNKRRDRRTEEEEINVQLKVIQLVKLDLQRAVEFHDQLFVG